MQKSDMQFLHILANCRGSEMVEYAQIECHDCFGIFPGNIMRRTSQSKAIGRSVQAGNPLDQDSMRHVLETATTHYDYSEALLCPNCLFKRRLKKFIKFALLAAVIGAGIYWYTTRSTSSGSDYDLGNNSDDNSESTEVRGDYIAEQSVAMQASSTEPILDETQGDVRASEATAANSDDTIAEPLEPVLDTPQPKSEAVRYPVPIGNRENWISYDDYPRQALKQQREGTTGFRLDVDDRGNASDCQITRPSGSSDLDAAACRVLMERSRFRPATNSQGQPVPSSYASTISWQLPDKPERNSKDVGSEIGNLLEGILTR